MTSQCAVVRLAAAMAFGAVLLACQRERKVVAQQGNSAATTLPTGVAATPAWPDHYPDLGRRATPAEVRAWNIDVNPSGEGLPAGSGNYAFGATLFAQKCASCHGSRGEGIGENPRLVGREPADSFPFGTDYRLPRTIGNYWPYATTLYDYINRAMPLTSPGSLQPDEVYSLVAYLLAENEIVGKNTVIDNRTLPAVKMPARRRFVVDDRTGGPTFR